MIVNINSDEPNITNANKSQVVEKTAPVPEVVLIGTSPDSNQSAHPNTAKAGQNEAVNHDVSRKEIDESVKDLNEHMQVIQRELHFTVDDDSGHTVIKVMDLATQQVIRQIPNEEALQAARNLGAGFDLELFSEYT